MSFSVEQLKLIKHALEMQNKELWKILKTERKVGFVSGIGSVIDDQEHLQRLIDCMIEDIENPCEMVTGD
jgi:hypothetical protein